MLSAIAILLAVILLYSAIPSRALPLNEGKFFWRVSFNSCVLSVLWNRRIKACAILKECATYSTFMTFNVHAAVAAEKATNFKIIVSLLYSVTVYLALNANILKFCHIYHSFLITTVPISVGPSYDRLGFICIWALILSYEISTVL